MEKGRWFFILILIVGALTVGRKRLEPLWDKITHDPAVGVIIIVLFLLLIIVVVKVIKQ